MQQPKLTIPSKIEVPLSTRHQSRNGVDIHVINTSEYEVIRVSFVFHAGTRSQQHPFVASATANMLAEGSKDYTSQQLAEKLDYYGSYFDVNIDRDYVYITFCSLKKFFAQTAELIEQIILYPTFPEKEVATYCAKRRQQLTIERRKVETRAREQFAQAIFGEDHPYGISSDEKEYDSITRVQIENHYRRLYTAQNCMIVCSGSISEDVLLQISKIAEQIPSTAECFNDQIPPFKTSHTNIVKHEGALQSSIRMGRLLFPRTHPDFIPMQVLSTILGGYFGSRLMQNLRERNGFTYGVFSAMVNFQHTGYLALATQVGKEVTHAALEQIAHEINILRTEKVEEEELMLVKNIMAGEMMRILDGPFGIADVTTENILCGFDNSHIQHNLERIRQTSPEEILSLAQKYLDPKDMVTVVVGDID